jgi:hypothetical protein
MKKNLLPFGAVAVGVICAALLLWLWSQDRAVARRQLAARPAPAPPAAPPVAIAPAASPDAFTRGLLGALEQLLTRADTRAKEGLLTFKDEAAYRRFLERAQKAGLTVLGQLDALRAVRVRYDSFSALRADLLANADDYAGVSANYLMTIPGPPAKDDRAALAAVPFGNRALEFLGVDPVSAARATWGQGVTIAILDTGVARDATFGDYRVRALDIGLGLTAGTGGEDGHGTAVASLAAGAALDAPGVAPAANLLSIRVTDASGASDLFTVAQAILAATDAGAKIINVSLGGYATSSALTAAIGYASEHGAVIVAAAGNDQAAQLTWPAADARVISVGAIDAAEQQVTFSNSGAQLQITAPGYGVQTAWLDGQRATVDGTSIGAPLVSGAIAAVLSQNPSLTPAEAWSVLQQTTNDAGAPGDDPDYGNGILNLGWAMNRTDVTRIDTAVSSHYYDAAASQMDFVVQNRSALAVSGLTLAIDAAGTGSTQPVPPLAPGATYVVKVPVSPAALATAGSMKFVTQLVNPAGLTDAVPANNRKSSVLSAPAPTK